jgi:hypothetical protein
MNGNQIYQWKQNGMQYIGDAQEIMEHLERLAESKGGGLTTDEIVADAMDEQSPLHPNIEKDDKVAAHNWRKHQVRGLVGSIVMADIQQTPAGEREYVVRAVAHVDGLYRAMRIVMTEPQLYDKHMETLKRDAAIFRRRISDVAEFAAVAQAIDELPIFKIGTDDGN